MKTLRHSRLWCALLIAAGAATLAACAIEPDGYGYGYGYDGPSVGLGVGYYDSYGIDYGGGWRSGYRVGPPGRDARAFHGGGGGTHAWHAAPGGHGMPGIPSGGRGGGGHGGGGHGGGGGGHR